MYAFYYPLFYQVKTLKKENCFLRIDNFCQFLKIDFTSLEKYILLFLLPPLLSVNSKKTPPRGVRLFSN